MWIQQGARSSDTDNIPSSELLWFHATLSLSYSSLDPGAAKGWPSWPHCPAMAEKSIDDAAASIPDLYNEVLKRMSDILIEGEKDTEIDDDLLMTLDGLLLRLKLWGMDVGDADGMTKLTEHNDLAASTRDSLETILMTIDLAKSLGIWQPRQLAGGSSTATYVYHES